MDPRTARYAVFAVVVAGLYWIDPLFIPLALLGPIVTGAVAGRRGTIGPAALVWFAAGVLGLASDWIVNQEDVGFHLVLAVWTAAVTLAVGSLTQFVARRRAVRTA